MRIRPYHPVDDASWDAVISRSWNGTFLHTRKFLSYHGDRFTDVSVMVEDDKKGLLGVFPAALDPEDERTVVSHPGVTFGGIIHAGELQGGRMIEVLQGLVDYYRASGHDRLVYKAVPYIYHRVPSSDDSYALFRVEARRFRCDLSATIDLHDRQPLDKARRYCLRKATQLGLGVVRGGEFLPSMWAILEENLSSRHGVQPVHSLAEIQELQNRFSDEIECVAASLNGEVIAGVVLFHTSAVTHTQYIAANAKGRDTFAQDLLFDDCLTKAALLGRRYFDFGISNEQGGAVLNQGLYKFKTDFGGGGVVHEFYELKLKETP